VGKDVEDVGEYVYLNQNVEIWGKNRGYFRLGLCVAFVYNIMDACLESMIANVSQKSLKIFACIASTASM